MRTQACIHNQARCFAQPHFVFLCWAPLSDVNECATDALLCGANGVCTDTVGSYTCSCKDGYQMVGSSCTSELGCLAHHSFSLPSAPSLGVMPATALAAGHLWVPSALHAKWHTCTAAADSAERAHNPLLAAAVCPPPPPGPTDINECTSSTANCVSPATCVDKDPAIDGAKFVCSCPSGYTASANNRTCDGEAKRRQLEHAHAAIVCT